jgi:hypothetical protein
MRTLLALTIAAPLLVLAAVLLRWGGVRGESVELHAPWRITTQDPHTP